MPIPHPTSVLFVCVHNAGRSQMAAGYLRHLAGDRIEVRSAGSIPADQINPTAVAAMLEDGIDIAGEQPKVLSDEAVRASDVVITMGCGDACPFYPGKRYEDWQLDDPAGQGIEAVRPIRDEIRRRIEALVAELTGPSPDPCCVPSASEAIDDAAAQRLAKVFKALGDPTRVKLLSLIAASPAGELCVCDLTEPVGLSQPTVSHHMKQLVEAGLATREQRGRWAYYRPTIEALTAATQELTPAESRRIWQAVGADPGKQDRPR